MTRPIPTHVPFWRTGPARCVLVIVVAVVLAQMVGCSKGGVLEPAYGYDQCLRREILKECMANLPAGPVSTKYNDWDEVVSECGTQAGRLSWRNLDNVKAECR